MIDGIQLKICGLTSLVDADAADAAGADYLGFVLHPASPRAVGVAQVRAMAGRLPPRKRVAVMVEPAAAALAEAADAEFDCFQVHFSAGTPPAALKAWSEAVGAERLWLAPRLPPGAGIEPAWLDLAKTVLLDTYDPAVFGGTGRTGDWAAFRRARQSHPATRWILSGGLNPENIAAALRESGARFADVNSGVEASPGVKDHGRIRALAEAIRCRG
jgi:phosphoribosylanthranilate isomerase